VKSRVRPTPWYKKFMARAGGAGLGALVGNVPGAVAGYNFGASLDNTQRVGSFGSSRGMGSARGRITGVKDPPPLRLRGG